MQHAQGLPDLAFQSQGLLVNDEDIRVEGHRRVPDDGFPNGERLIKLDVQAQRGIAAILQLDDPGNSDKVHPGTELKVADDRRSRKDQDRDALVAAHQFIGDRSAAAEMAEPEAVVTVYQYTAVIETGAHRESGGCW